MEQRDITESDLVGILGSQAVVSAVINGQQEISKAQAQALGEFFRVDCDLFI